MKVSLAWIFDHIDADWKQQDVEEIVSRFNAVTAEIESFERISIDLKKLFMANVVSCSKKQTQVRIPQLKKEISLPSRPASKTEDTSDIVGSFFLLSQEKSGEFRWATVKDLGPDKEGLLPAFDLSDDQASGAWRDEFESEDILFDVDNKSLTHRPDMWGYRGFAREIAAFLELPLTAKANLCATDAKKGEPPSGGFNPQVQNFEKKSKASSKNPFVLEIKAPKAASRLSGLYIESIENKPSNVFIASRLVKVGLRPINGIVDLTNYVMLDWSQPVHAYDAQKIAGKKLIARMARDGEELELLGDKKIELSSKDLVIADGDKAVGLAGIKGGLHDSIGAQTDSIFFEAAHFEPASIRRTSLRHGIRTDSSVRFEKMLDPNQITDAILRFIALCHQTGIDLKITSDIIAVGKPFEEKTIGVRHSFLEKRSGVTFSRDEVVDPLKRLGFQVSDVEELLGDEQDRLYTIIIPSYRGAKDVQIQEDILEEVLRFFGLNRIALVLPELKKEPHDLTPLLKERKVKNFLAYSAQMMEQRNYLYYDEDFLREVGLDIDEKSSLRIKNPVSENNVRLATSLLPNLFKNIRQNCASENSLRFFECGRTCRVTGDNVIEEKKVAGIFFEKRKSVDFYRCKAYLSDLFLLCGVSSPGATASVTWKKIDEHSREYDWVMPYQSAELFIKNRKVGVAGKVTSAFLCKLDALPESEAFFFELDMDRLCFAAGKEGGEYLYTPISKFQGVTFDLSFMVPLELTVAELQEVLLDSDDLIERVELLDFFDKKEWVDQRSVAFRLRVSNPEKTLLKEEISDVSENACKAAKKIGAQARE